MQDSLQLSCQCGSLGARVELPKGLPIRCVCYCEDCQAYARFLGQADTLLDEHGGTDIIQLSPASFSIRRGKEHLGNLRLSEKGIYRWYATCCNTPICNTPQSPKMPYLGLITRNLAVKKKLDSVIGPVSFGVGAGRQYPIEAAWPVAKGFGFRGMLSTLKNIGRWRMAGDQNRSELIDAATGKPAVKPRTLTREERSALDTS